MTSCNKCDACWDQDRRRCANADYVGVPMELHIVRESIPAAACARMNRASLNLESLQRAERGAVGCIICEETHKDEQTHPWVMGVVITAVHPSSKPYDAAIDPIHLDQAKEKELVLKIQLYEALTPGSSVYFLSDLKVVVLARKVCLPPSSNIFYTLASTHHLDSLYLLSIMLCSLLLAGTCH